MPPYRNLKKRTDDALTLFSKSHDTSGIVVPGYQYFVEKFNEMVLKLKEIALFPESVDTMQSEDDQKLFVVTFRELTKYLQSLQTFIEFSFDQDALIMSEQEYQDYKSKYLMLYSRQKADREVVSVLNDVDFCIELMESDRINVASIYAVLPFLQNGSRTLLCQSRGYGERNLPIKMPVTEKGKTASFLF